MTTAEFHFFDNRSYVDLYPIQFGKEICEPLHSFGPSKRKHFLFHYIISGKGTFFDTKNQKEYRLRAGQGFLIPPNHLSSYEADFSDPWTYIWLEFNGLKAEHFLKRAGLTFENLIFSSRNHNIKNAVYNEMNYIIENYKTSSLNILAHTYLFADALINESIITTKTEHEEVKEIYIREAINFIERNYQSSITVDDIAKHCNLNRSYFSRLFKEQMSITPQQFLITYRLSKACELLKNTKWNLQEIAEAIGYSNQFNFSIAFKRFFGQSPNTWRKNYDKSLR
ncbi:AraC family transcriptional regulator [Streptococcus pacificus]|uniref:AraC family transcriptional regulator n=1 Tax=Streptococcus pacificus TaxID=2740577 RepID=A0ABS0ZH06_9STRE|nr:AraC family transcriptional regulator [Streptococcus pacificus]MBJ8325289.1 AraC family transcriptional regulator [Streptococcus pacificus]